MEQSLVIYVQVAKILDIQKLQPKIFYVIDVNVKMVHEPFRPDNTQPEMRDVSDLHQQQPVI